MSFLIDENVNSQIYLLEFPNLISQHLADCSLVFVLISYSWIINQSV